MRRVIATGGLMFALATAELAFQQAAEITIDLAARTETLYRLTPLPEADVVIALDADGTGDRDLRLLDSSEGVIVEDLRIEPDATVRVARADVGSKELVLVIRNLGPATKGVLRIEGARMVEGSRRERQLPPEPTAEARAERPSGSTSPPPPPAATASPSAPRPGPPAAAGQAIVPVFYATDRTRVPGQAIAYGTSRNSDGSLALGRFDVSIPRDGRHLVGQIERPTIWTLWREDPQRHFVIVSRRQQTYDEFYADLGGVVSRSEEKQAFVFIHGFNVSFEGAVFRTAQIAYDLGFDGAPILYSWPSQESLTPIGYATDAATNEWTVPHLRSFLDDVARRSGARRVHLIAHSMGNKALVNALAGMPPSATRKFAQIVLTAPDIDADVFVQLADAVRRSGQMATLYVSANDKALLASKSLQTYRRAGDTSGGVVIVPGIDTVDVSAVDTNLVGHFYYGENTSVISDMFLVLAHGMPPSKRPRLRPVGAGPGRFWRFVP